MTQYLKIENQGIAPVEGFTVLGASTSKGNVNSNIIGVYGSGSKYSVGVCLRHKINPIIFCGTRRLDFFTKPQKINDGISNQTFERVCVKNSGKDGRKTYNSTEDLGFVLDYGATDWDSINLALREFISNAIDRSYKESDQKAWEIWLKLNKITTQEEADRKREEWEQYINEYNLNAKPFQSVQIEIVEENQVRAKSDTTRVFLEMNDSIYEYYQNLGRHFLHFREPSLLKQTILPKRDRNLGTRRTAVIYKKGVRVREFQSSDIPSIFDYNLNDLVLDESRQVDDWKVRNEAGRALARADKETLAKLLKSFSESTKYWEHEFDAYSLEPAYYDTSEDVEKRGKVWQEAFHAIAGENAVPASTAVSVLVTNKGYKPVAMPESFVNAAARYGLKTAEKILTQDDLEGRVITDATKPMVAAVDYIWSALEEEKLTLGKEKPEVKGFKETSNCGVSIHGYYKEEIIYLNEAFAPTSGYANQYPEEFLSTVLEELSHFISGAKDDSRDFQNYAFKVATTFIRKNSI